MFVFAYKVVVRRDSYDVGLGALPRCKTHFKYFVIHLFRIALAYVVPRLFRSVGIPWNVLGGAWC